MNKNSKIIICFILLALINLIIICFYNNYKSPLEFQISFLNVKTAFAIDDINNNNDSNFANKYNAILINELNNKDKQLVLAGYFKEAIKLADHILSLEKNNIRALKYKGIALDNLGNHTGAIQFYDKHLALVPNDTEVLVDKGVALDNLDNETGAIQFYDKALVINPNDTNALNNKGLALDKLGNHTGAIQFYDKHLALVPNDTDTLYNKGLALDKLGNHTGAIQFYDKALVINPNDTNALNNKAVDLDKIGRYQEALTSFNIAINHTQPNIDIDTLSNKAHVLGIDLKEYDEALSLINLYLKKNPEHKGLLCTATRIFDETNNKGLADYYKEKLNKLDPYYSCALITKVSTIEKESFV